MRSFLLAISSVAFFLTSCDNKPQVVETKKQAVFSNDTEPNEWIGGETVKERPNAHSGKSVSVIDTVNQYSLGFNMLASKACDEKINKVVITYWVFFKNAQSKANTVISIDGNGKNVYWLGSPIQDRVKEYNKWVQVTEVFKIPVDVKPDDFVKIYVWNVSKEEILVDDIHIAFN